MSLSRSALLLCFFISVYAKKQVVELTSSNFDALVTAGGNDWMVEVYAPWCGHCKRMEPQYERAAQELSGQVRVGRIDGSRYRSLMTRFDVAGYPTFFHVEGATGAVRRAGLAGYTAEAVVRYATRDYKAASPMSGWSSPNGPWKRLLFVGMTAGESCKCARWVELGGAAGC